MSGPRHQHSLVLGAESDQRLQRLSARLDASKVGVFRASLQLLEYLLDANKHGSKVLIQDQGGTQRELVILGLAEVDS